MRLPTSTSFVVLALGLASLAACGGGGDPAGPSVFLSGTYQTSARSQSGRLTTGRASIQQPGSTLTGSYSNNRGGVGRVTGSVSGDRATFQLVATNNTVTCDIDAIASSDGSQVNGTFSCADGDAGDFTASRI